MGAKATECVRAARRPHSTFALPHIISDYFLVLFSWVILLKSLDLSEFPPPHFPPVYHISHSVVPTGMLSLPP